MTFKDPILGKIDLSEKTISRICIQWPRFGPYHLARLRAAHNLFSSHGTEIIGMETAGRDSTYAWRVEENSEPFQRIRLFPTHSYDLLKPAEIYHRVFDTLNRLNPDGIAINSYSLPDSRACLEWCKINKKIAILCTDSKEDDAPRRYWREKIKSLIVGQYDTALVAGTFHRDYLVKLGFAGDRIFFGFDVVDNDYFSQRAREALENRQLFSGYPGLRATTPFFLTVCRFIPRKNLHVLLSAYLQYRLSAASPWNLVILGDGPLRAELERRVEEEEIEGITFAGFRQIEDIPVYYGLAGVYIHPALIDQWGLAVNEAMASGLPVLVSKAAGCAVDLVKDDVNGYVFDPKDPDELANLMYRISSAGEDLVKMGKESERIISSWNLDLYAQNLYRAVTIGISQDQPTSIRSKLILLTLRFLSRDVRSFHSVSD